MSATFREEDIGPHIVGKDRELQERERVEDHRNGLTERFSNTKATPTNTLFYKIPQHQITYKRDKASGTEPPFNKNQLDTIDYIIVFKRWKKSVKDT